MRAAANTTATMAPMVPMAVLLPPEKKSSEVVKPLVELFVSIANYLEHIVVVA